MRVKNYYVIRANDLLKKISSSIDDTSREILCSPQLWESEEGGRGVVEQKDYEARIKICFLANLGAEYSSFLHITELLKEGASLDLFDKYWRVDSIDLVGSVKEISARELIAIGAGSTGNEFVDEWINAVLKGGAPTS